jgi:predicted RNase H-like nuclease (RuvC/YqgF family)
MTIYELTADFLRIQEMMEDPELDPQTLADTMEAVDGELEVKAENYAKVMKNLDGDIEALDNEIRRLMSRKKALENNIKNMKMALQSMMTITGKTKFKTDLFSFGIQKNAPSVVIDTDINNLPTEFLKFREPEVDKTKLKEALKNGEDLSGYCHLEQSESLRIR